MTQNIKSSDNLFKIAMSIGSSLDLIPMLEVSVSTIHEALHCYAVSVLFFSNSRNNEFICKNVYSLPENIENFKYYHKTMESIDDLHKEMDLKLLMQKLPAAGCITADEGMINYNIILLPYIGLMLLFYLNEQIDEDTMRELVKVGEKLATACSACLQNKELETMFESSRSINNELRTSELLLKESIRRIKNDQEELSSNKIHIALILQSLGEGIIVVDENLHITIMNVKAMEYLDYVPDIHSIFTIVEMFKSCYEDPEIIVSFINDIQDDASIDIAVTTKQLTKRDLRISKNRISDLYVGVREIILMVRDVTAEKEVDRLKNEFISNLSHELRTPMNAILGISNVILKKNSENLSSRQREGLNIIYDSGQRLLVLINDLLDLSKIEAGKMEIMRENCNVHKIIKDIENVAIALVGDRDISIETKIDDTVPDDIFSDKYRIQQVLTNLISNSVKFTEKGTIALRVSIEDEFLVFNCIDTGIGISKEDIPFIFDRFKQVDGSLSRKYSGTGLGLNLSREIARLLGGNISVESTLGTGTHVKFKIPNESKKNALHHLPGQSKPPRHWKSDNNYDSSIKTSILVVDDESAGRETIAMILDSDFEIAFAENGQEAVSMFCKMRPDIILMDIMMPIMDGIHALHGIRAESGGSEVPVIAVTAHAMRGERERIKSFGFNGFVAKPIDENYLLTTIRYHVAKSRYLKNKNAEKMEV
jgi:signal transduction histidine kinase/AmiR/NasT family two-component response regulator